MFTDQFTHELNSYLKRQGDSLLEKQKSVFEATYTSRSGSLARALASKSTATGNLFGGASVEVAYPIHIRFLDMKKRWSKKNERMVRKKKYAPIYNKYVYGYLKSAVWKKLNELIPRMMIRTIEENIKSVK